MRRAPAPLRLRILAGAALCALVAGAAHAQSEPIRLQADVAEIGPGERLEASGHVQAETGQGTINAERLSRDDAGRMEASGGVEAVVQSTNRRGEPQSRSLRAGQVVFDPNNATISASGDIRIYQPDGTVEHADTIVMTQSLQSGVATNFAVQLPENGTIAASSVIRRDETFSEMNQAIFTACALCDDEGNDKTPTWAISAEKVVRDTEDGSVNFRNAWISFGGTRVIPLPFFSMADPAVDRKSGLLAPDFQQTSRRGLSYSQPWLWAISPYSELILTPQLNTEVNPFLTGDYRKRFHSGLLEAEAGYTYERDFNNAGVEFGPNRAKAYVFSNGRFELSPVWRWGFTAQGARDRRLFDQYSIDYSPPDRGLFVPGDRRLISQIYAARRGEESYISIAAMGFQSLRPLPGPPGPFGLRPLEDDDTLPFVGPLVEFRYDPQASVAGGRFRLVGSGVALNREASPFIPGAPGVDTSRASVEADWRDTYTSGGGLRFEPFLNLRGDFYRTGDLTPAETVGHSSSRSIATAGADLSWPLVKIGNSVTTTIEPMIQLAASQAARIDPDIPNEDSLAYQFDDSNLFDFDRAPGFDLYEGGQRMSMGVRTTFDWGEGRNARFLVGRTYRDEPNPLLPVRTGLSGRSSDWIVAADATPTQGLYLFARGRFDDSELRHIEAGVDASLERTRGYLRYLRTDQDASGRPAEDIEGQGEVFLSKTWGILASATRDMEQQQWRRRSIGAVYQDECLRFELLYQRENNPLLGARDSSSIVFRLTLATLGNTGYSNPAAGPTGTRP